MDSTSNENGGTDYVLKAPDSQVAMWSRYKRIQDIVLNPIHPLIVLIGDPECTSALKKILHDQARVLQQQLQAGVAGQADETSKFNFDINTYQFQHKYKPTKSNPSPVMPPFYKEQLSGFASGMFKKHSNQHELGYIKVRFFDSLTIFKPAVTVLSFDWQNLPIGTFDWPTQEKGVLDEVKNFQDNCMVSAKDTKIIILILLPLNEEVNADECRNSLKNALRQRNPDEQQYQNIKQILVNPNGILSIQSNPKNLVKHVFENCNQYYANKKRDVKAKQRKLINKDQTENVRYAFKIGVYSQLSKGELPTSLKYMREAYESIKLSGAGNSSLPLLKSNLEERRDNADLICLQMLVYLLD